MATILKKGTTVKDNKGNILKVTKGQPSKGSKSSGSSSSSMGYVGKQDYSITGNPQVDAVNKAKATELANRKTGASSSTQDVDSMFNTGVPGLNPSPEAASGVEAPQTQTGTQMLGVDNVSQPADMGEVNRYKQKFEEQDMASRYRQGFEEVQSSGAPAPQSAGEATSQIQPYIRLGTSEPDISGVDGLLLEDKGWQELQEMKNDYFSPESQRTSLMDEYKKLYRQSGLDDLDEEIIDAKSIVEGTEDDIRNEIQMAGGFGTDSQVQALASARNKVLLKNYNNLVSLRELKQQNLDRMLDLAEKDRSYADQQMERAFNFSMQELQYRDKFTQNTRDQLQNIIDKVGYQGLYQAYSQDPRQLAFAESILGVGSGGLSNLASQRDLDRELKEAQIADKHNQMSSNGGGGKPITSASALQIADSNAAMTMLSDLEDAIYDKSNLFGPIKGRISGANPYNTSAQDVQSLVNSTKQIVGKYLEGGVLRAEDEAKYAKILPKLSDTPEVAVEKLANVRRLVESKVQAQQSTLEAAGYNPAVVSNGNTFVGPDGNEYEITN